MRNFSNGSSSTVPAPRGWVRAVFRFVPMDRPPSSAGTRLARRGEKFPDRGAVPFGGALPSRFRCVRASADITIGRALSIANLLKRSAGCAFLVRRRPFLRPYDTCAVFAALAMRRPLRPQRPSTAAASSRSVPSRPARFEVFCPQCRRRSRRPVRAGQTDIRLVLTERLAASLESMKVPAMFGSCRGNERYARATSADTGDGQFTDDRTWRGRRGL
jgi:hypothetical protein